MFLRKFTVLVSFLILFCTSGVQTAQERGIILKEDRLALVIGNGAYHSSPLENPINDVEDMAAALKKIGFKVILKRNADQRTMEDAIRYFGRQLRHGGVGLFYFAGHGVQVEGRNYLIPVDAKIESESDVRYEAVDSGRILGKMEDAENRLNIVILDACRNNPYARAFRSDQNGLARMDAPTGSLVAYSTAPGEVAADGTERNGIFTKYLIQHMLTPNLSIEHVLKRVRVDVARQTNGRQIPWESSSLMGDFYFNLDKTTNKTGVSGKLQIPPEKASETQVASIYDENTHNIEPWTGTWKVSGHFSALGTWVLKQRDEMVVSTKDSAYEIEGKVTGNYFDGRLKSISDPSFFWTIQLKMSPDDRLIEGTSVGKNTSEQGHIKGRRQKK